MSSTHQDTRCGEPTTRGRPCRNHRDTCGTHRHDQQVANPAAAGHRFAVGGSGFRDSVGRFVAPGVDPNPDIREERGYGSPGGTAGIYHEMVTTLPAVTLLVKLYAGPIQSLHHDFRYATHGTTDPAVLDFLRQSYFDDCENWETYLQQKLEALVYGYMPFEVETGIGASGALVPLRFLQRMPFSIEKIFRKDERLDRIEQRVQRDDGTSGTRTVTIPAERLMWHTHGRQADHLTGMPLIRPAYGPWRNILDLWRYVMIRMERMATPTPAFGLDDANFNNAVVKDHLQEVSENWRASAWSHLVYPRGPDGQNRVEFVGGSAASDDIVQLCRYFAWEILSAGAGQFLALGTTSTGSRSVGDVQARVFWRSLQAVVRENNEPINDRLGRTHGSIRWLVDNNLGPQKVYPRLVAPVPRAETLESFAKAMLTLKQAGFLVGTAEDNMMLRDEQQLPQLGDEHIAAIEEAIEIMRPKPDGVFRSPPDDDDPPPADDDGTDDDMPMAA